MISNYNLDCDYHNFELKDKIYLIPESALKIIYTDGYNEAVFTGDDSNVTILEGYDISFQEESSFDERFKFSRTLSIKVDGYKTFNDLNYRYMVIIETKDGEFYIVNSDFQSFVTHTYTLTNGTNSTELVFSSQSNIPTIKLTGFEPNVVNSCKVYNIPKIRKIKLADLTSNDSSISTWKRYLINRGVFANVEPLPDSISLQEEFDGEKYTVILGFDIPMNYFKNDWHIKLLQFDKNKYRGYIQLEDGNIAFVGYNTGLFPSYTINGDIISIRLTETSIRGISYGNDYAVIDTDMPKSIYFEGSGCNNYSFESSCNWEVESKPNYITITPMSGNANTNYQLQICNTDGETSYAVSEFVINTCSTNFSTEIVVSNPIYRWVDTNETMCTPEIITRTTSGIPYCDNYDKYVDVYNEVSYDGGQTWEISSTTATLVEGCSDDCGVWEYFHIISLENGNTITPVFESGYTLYYSYDKIDSNFVAINSGETISNIGANQKIYFKGRKQVVNPYAEVRFNVSKNYNVAGNIQTIMWGTKCPPVQGDGGWRCQGLFSGDTHLISAADLIMPSSPPDYYAAIGMFSGCTNLVAAPELPATEVRPLSYQHMFYGCESLTTPPALPATKLGYDCYESMFAGCTSLTSAPELPATELETACYLSMFDGCSSLTTPPALPATTLADSCYYSMFNGCTSLTSAPELPATALTEICYSLMFAGCTSLTDAPELPATALTERCYFFMFAECTSLTDAPELPATTLTNSCYYGMFNGCTSLTAVTSLSATTLAEQCCWDMFEDCTSLVTIPSDMLPATTLVDGCYKEMFHGCTSLTTMPELPATTLAVECYKEMFANCTSLTAVTDLSATTLAKKCYDGMFAGCTSLTTPPQILATTYETNCFAIMFEGCTSLTESPVMYARYLPSWSCYNMYHNCSSLSKITCLATDKGSYSTESWVDGVAASGTFYKDSNTGWGRGVNGVPSGWTIVNYTG